MQIDWFQVITDVERSGMTQRQIASHLRASKSSVVYWKAGNTPRYDDGEALIRLWGLVTSHDPQEVPYMQWQELRYRKR